MRRQVWNEKREQKRIRIYVISCRIAARECDDDDEPRRMRHVGPILVRFTYAFGRTAAQRLTFIRNACAAVINFYAHRCCVGWLAPE